MRGEAAQREARVGHENLRHRKRCRDELRGERGRGAAPRGFLDIRMAVEALTLQGDEEIAGVHRAAVGGDAGEAHRGALHAPLHGASGFIEIHHPCFGHVLASVHFAPVSHSARAACATSRSLNGWRTPAISW